MHRKKLTVAAVITALSLSDLGAAILTSADTAQTLDYLERAVRSDPAMATAWFNLAVVRLGRDDRSAAVVALERFIATAGQRYPDQVLWARRVMSEMERR